LLESLEFIGFVEFVGVARLLRPDKSGLAMTPTLSLRGAEDDEAISRRGMVLLHFVGNVGKEARDDKEEYNAIFIFA
jgi:hypothetical protein